MHTHDRPLSTRPWPRIRPLVTNNLVADLTERASRSDDLLRADVSTSLAVADEILGNAGGSALVDALSLFVNCHTADATNSNFRPAHHSATPANRTTPPMIPRPGSPLAQPNSPHPDILDHANPDLPFRLSIRRQPSTRFTQVSFLSSRPCTTLSSNTRPDQSAYQSSLPKRLPNGLPHLRDK